MNKHMSVLVDQLVRWFVGCHLDALWPAKQGQMLVEDSPETLPGARGESGDPAELGVMADGIIARWEQGGCVAKPLPLPCQEIIKGLVGAVIKTSSVGGDYMTGDCDRLIIVS